MERNRTEAVLGLFDDAPTGTADTLETASSKDAHA